MLENYNFKEDLIVSWSHVQPHRWVLFCPWSSQHFPHIVVLTATSSCKPSLYFQFSINPSFLFLQKLVKSLSNSYSYLVVLQDKLRQIQSFKSLFEQKLTPIWQNQTGSGQEHSAGRAREDLYRGSIKAKQGSHWLAVA